MSEKGVKPLNGFSRKILALGIWLWVAGVVGTHPARSQPIVAVFDIDGRNSKIPVETLDSLADCLAASMSISAGFPIVLRDQVKAALPMENNQRKPCYDFICQIEIAKKLHAHKVLATVIHKLGGDCVLTATLSGISLPVTQNVAKLKVSCAPAELVQTLDKVAEQLKKAVHDPIPADPSDPEGKDKGAKGGKKGKTAAKVKPSAEPVAEEVVEEPANNQQVQESSKNLQVE